MSKKFLGYIVVIILAVLIFAGGYYFILLKEDNNSSVKQYKITLSVTPEENKLTPTTKTTTHIKKDGVEVAQIETLNGMPATFVKQTNKYAYFDGNHPTGVGGSVYQYFSSVYRLNLDTNKLDKISYSEGERYYILDISDKDIVVWANEGRHKIVLQNYDNNNEVKIFNTVSDYNRLSQAKISPNGNYIAYEIGSDTFGSNEELKNLVYILNTETNKSSKLLEEPVVTFDRWLDNNTLQVKTAKSMSDGTTIKQLSI